MNIDDLWSQTRDRATGLDHFKGEVMTTEDTLKVLDQIPALSERQVLDGIAAALVVICEETKETNRILEAIWKKIP